MNKRALIVWGGWSGHEPKDVAALIADGLKEHGFEVEVSDTLDAFLDAEKLKKLNLIVPCWTMGQLKGEEERPLCGAVASGVGIAGLHGGMCDAFRNNTEYQFMTGGQWVSHPGGGEVRYSVEITDTNHFITKDSKDFEVVSEQYYLHTDPANKVLATTQFPVAEGRHTPNGKVAMPVVWTKRYGDGRVAYCSLGHNAKVSAQPEVKRLWLRCCLWAAHADAQA